jgi:hypothetical protein
MLASGEERCVEESADVAGRDTRRGGDALARASSSARLA